MIRPDHLMSEMFRIPDARMRPRPPSPAVPGSAVVRTSNVRQYVR